MSVIYSVTVSSGKAMTVEELFESRSWQTGGGGSETRNYVVTGSENEFDVNEAVERSAPGGTQLGYVRNTISGAFPISLNGDSSVYRVTVDYVSPTGFQGATREIPVGTARFRFTASTSDQTVVVPYQWYSRTAPPGKKTVEYEGLGDDGEVFKGVSVPRNSMAFSFDFNIPNKILTPAYVASLLLVADKLNQYEWKGFDVRSVMCTGIDGTFSTDWLNRDVESSTQLSFNFEPRPDVLVKYPPGDVAPPEGFIDAGWVSGWYYHDVHTKTTINPDPRKVHVGIEQVDVAVLNETFDFNLLQIPGGDVVDSVEWDRLTHKGN